MKQLKAFEFFGRKAQINKLIEELNEIAEEVNNYAHNPCKATALQLILEVYDIANVAEGIALYECVCINKALQEKEMKNIRTEKIIKQIPKDCVNKVEAYEGIRKEH